MSHVKRKSVFQHAQFQMSCACAKYHPGLCSPLIHFVVSNDSVRGQWMPWSDCAGWSGPSLSAYMHEDTFSYGAIDSQLLTLKAPRKTAAENVVCLCRLLNILAAFSNLFLHTGKQCRPWSERSSLIVWSGSTLFAKITFKITSRWQSRRQ